VVAPPLARHPGDLVGADERLVRRFVLGLTGGLRPRLRVGVALFDSLALGAAGPLSRAAIPGSVVLVEDDPVVGLGVGGPLLAALVAVRPRRLGAGRPGAWRLDGGDLLRLAEDVLGPTAPAGPYLADGDDDLVALLLPVAVHVDLAPLVAEDGAPETHWDSLARRRVKG
jgi:hypothetical protein